MNYRFYMTEKYKLTICENRLEVLAYSVDEETMEDIMERVQEWLNDKTISDDDYLAALGPCGK